MRAIDNWKCLQKENANGDMKVFVRQIVYCISSK